ncbi:hypothetical protein KSC_030310 [Ktedonobacter sp. SOSP1-52]|nr:hypothetical protein KSC_030310 [Ktedonobacter sp. SOSP1-52]
MTDPLFLLFSPFWQISFLLQQSQRSLVLPTPLSAQAKRGQAQELACSSANIQWRTSDLSTLFISPSHALVQWKVGLYKECLSVYTIIPQYYRSGFLG